MLQVLAYQHSVIDALCRDGSASDGGNRRHNRDNDRSARILCARPKTLGGHLLVIDHFVQVNSAHFGCRRHRIKINSIDSV